MMKPACVLSLLLLNVSAVCALFLRLGQTDRKCFLAEVPDDTRVVVKLQVDDEHLSDSPDLRMLVEASGPDHQLVLSQRFGPERSFCFTSRMAGVHQVCLQVDPSQRPLPAGDVLTVHLDVTAGERTNNYTEMAVREKLTMLQLRVRQLSQQVHQILKELRYQRVREKRFRDVDHSTNMWMFWFPVARSLFVVGIITWSTKSW